MDRVEQIEAAITSLPAEEYRCLVEWFRTREQTRWDEQMDQDSAAGGRTILPERRARL
jgi:hypothetical protein